MAARLGGHTLALGVATILSIAQCGGDSPDERLRREWQKLDARPLAGRLAHFSFKARAGRPVAVAQLHGAAAVVTTTCGAREATHRCGVAYLLTGDYGEAVRRLTQANQSTGDEDTANDLAVACLERGRATNNPLDYVSALAATDDALNINPRNASALFNRIVALSSLSLARPAAVTLSRLLVVESAGPWAAEASRQIPTPHIRRRSAWLAVIPSIENAVEANDLESVRLLTRNFRLESRKWAEGEFAARWAEAASRDDSRAATHWLRVARAIGDVLATTSNDWFLAEEISAIDHASPRHREKLASAHLMYRRGRMLYDARHVTAGLATLRRSSDLFDEAGSPMTLYADYFAANALVDAGRTDEAIHKTERLSRNVPARYRSLHAQLDWLLGTAYGSQGLFFDAIRAYSTALNEFDSLGETDYANFMRYSMAWTYAAMGNDLDAWRVQRQGFAALNASGDIRTLQNSLVAAANNAMQRGYWREAKSLLRIAIEVLPGSNNQDVVARALVWRALSATKVPRSNVAREFNIAREAATTLSDPALRNNVVADLDIADAAHSSDPLQKLRFLTSALANGREDRIDRPEILLIRSRAYRAIGDSPRAEIDLRRAAEIVEYRQSAIREDNLRDSYFGSAAAIYDEMIDLAQSRGDIETAFEFAERSRGRIFRQRGAANRRARHILSQIGDREVVLEFVSLRDRLLLFTLNRKTGLQCHVVPKMRQPLRSEIVNTANGGEDGFRQLYADLIRPANIDFSHTTHLTIVTDDTTAGVPFAALFDVRTGEYLVEQACLRFSPSADLHAPVGLHAPRSILVVGDPTHDRDKFPDLSPLLASRIEAAMIPHVYRRSTVLTGTKATKRALIAEISNFDVVHIASHAIVNPYDREVSSIILAKADDEPSQLTLREVLALRLKAAPIVVLAGCETARMSGEFGDLRSFANAFLRAGARGVIATIDNLDDNTSRKLSLRLHEELAHGVPPAIALQRAQISMIHSRGTKVTPYSWGVMQYVGN